jgi:hypothetical protein
MAGVVKVLVPVPPGRMLPPDAAAYQSSTQPEGGVAERVAVLPTPQAGTTTAPVGAAGNELMVAVTAVRVAETQPVVVLRAVA